MKAFAWPEWDQVFLPDGSLLESFLRGVAVYLAVLILFRVVMKRQLGSLGFGDVLLLVLVSECVSQALSDNKNSVPNGIAAVTALLLCNYLIDYLTYRSRWLRSILQPDPIRLVLNGQPIRKNLEKERISDDELLAHLRLNGIENPSQAKSVCLESEGEISVIRQKEDPSAGEAGPDEAGEDGSGPPDIEAELRRFLDTARRLHRAVAWHEERAADHRRLAAEARDALKRCGIQPRVLRQPLADAPDGTKAVTGVHTAASGSPT
jgi:uncharacterized membrane protein YcaP (DUF421 family)